MTTNQIDRKAQNMFDRDVSRNIFENQMLIQYLYTDHLCLRFPATLKPISSSAAIATTDLDWELCKITTIYEVLPFFFLFFFFFANFWLTKKSDT